MVQDTRTRTMFSALFWGVLALVGFGYELYAIRKADDEHEPLTYYVRKVFNLRNRSGPLWWILLGFWLWLGLHFFIDKG